MKNQFKNIILVASLTVNVLITLPAVVLFLGSSSIQLNIYQNILARRFGEPEIVFIGDSLVAGGGVWALRIGKYDLNVWNYGYGGFTTRQLQFIVQDISRDKGTEYAFVMAGINDSEKTKAGAVKSFEDYKVIIDTLRENGVEPIIQHTLYRENEKSPEFIDDLNKYLADYANALGLTHIDLNAQFAPNKSLLPKYSSDGLHLTEAAYDVWGNEVKRVLEMKQPQKMGNG